MKGMNLIIVLLLVVLFFASSSPPVQAQTTFGTMTGTVKDSSGAVLPDAAITVTSDKTGATRQVSTDANGIPLANADDRPRADDFESKILVMARGYASGQRPDFANASFAELFAWSLAG